MTLEQVGLALGARHTTVGRWEKGEIPPTTENLEALADLYGIDPERLMTNPADRATTDEAAALDLMSKMAPQDRTEWLQLGPRFVRREG